MGRFWAFALSTLALSAKLAFSQDVEEDVDELSPGLAVSVGTTFPAASEIFGVKLVNGQATEAILDFNNEETEPITINFIGGSLFTPDTDPAGSRIVRNLTASKFAIEIPAGEKQSISYNFITDLHPQELRLNLAAVLSDSKGAFYTIQAYNSTVSVVEPDTSIFDPQIIFLYLFLAAIFAGTIYFFYTVWIVPYFPKKKASGGERTKRTTTPKKIETVEGSPVEDASAVASGAKAYNEDWIPAHHLQRPEARRVKSGGPKPKGKGKAE